MSDILTKSDNLSNQLVEKPYIVFSEKAAEELANQTKQALKEINDLFVKKQKNKPPRAQELFIKGFDEEQIWVQLKSNDDLINARTEKLLANIFENQDKITLIPGEKPKPVKIVNEDEEDDEEDEDEIDEEDIEGEEGFDEEDGEGELGVIGDEDIEDGDEDDEDDLEVGEDEDDDQGALVRAEGLGDEDEDDYEDAEDDEEEDLKAMAKNKKKLAGKIEDVNVKDMEKILDEMDEMDPVDLEEEEEGDFDEEGMFGEEGMYGLEEEEEEESDEGPKKVKFRGLATEDDEDEEEGEEGAEEGDEVDDAEDEVFERAREDLLADEPEQPEDEAKKRQDEISALEEKLIEKKTWTVKGEIKAFERPLNSLLETHLDFDVKKKTPKTISHEYTKGLEAMIKQRILDEAWDDPIQYSSAKPLRETFSNLQEIEFEKSSKGLADVMEEKYKKDVMKIQTATPQDDLQKEVDILFKKLCYNLDVLSNLNFVPKPTFEQPKIVANVASIQLEEKTPLGFSLANQKAPQEVFDPKKVNLKSTEDLTSEDRQAIRNQNKRNIRQRKKEQKKKELIKKLEHKGETKFEYNLMKKGLSKYKTAVDKKNQQSVKFTKSNQFFENMEKSKDAKKKQAEAPPVPTAKKQNFKL